MLARKAKIVKVRYTLNMPKYEIVIKITPRAGLLDPAGQAVEKSLKNLGFTGVSDLFIGRLILFNLEAETESEARAIVEKMCHDLLVNPITEDYIVEVTLK